MKPRMVVSVDAAYTRMRDQAPELAERLFEPVATDRRGEQPAGEQPWFEIPVLSPAGDRVTGIYQRQYIDSARRFADAPTPDAQYVQALDLFDDKTTLGFGACSLPAFEQLLAFRLAEDLEF